MTSENTPESTERRVQYFRRIGATVDMAEKLVTEFESVSDFLNTPFVGKLEAVTQPKQARTITDKYRSFENMRDMGGSRAFRSLDGVGSKSAMQVDYSYIRRTVCRPRDVLSAQDVAEKMGFDTERHSPVQAELENWNEIRSRAGNPPHTTGQKDDQNA